MARPAAAAMPTASGTCPGAGRPAASEPAPGARSSSTISGGTTGHRGAFSPGVSETCKSHELSTKLVLVGGRPQPPAGNARAGGCCPGRLPGVQALGLPKPRSPLLTAGDARADRCCPGRSPEVHAVESPRPRGRRVTAGNARADEACPGRLPGAAADSRRPLNEGEGQTVGGNARLAAAVLGRMPEETDGPTMSLSTPLGDCPAAFTTTTVSVPESATSESAWQGVPYVQ